MQNQEPDPADNIEDLHEVTENSWWVKCLHDSILETQIGQPLMMTSETRRAAIELATTVRKVEALMKDLQPLPKDFDSNALADLMRLYSWATPGLWRRGESSHHVESCKYNNSHYKVAEFHHADDAVFCVQAHEVMPLVFRLIRQLRAPYLLRSERQGTNPAHLQSMWLFFRRVLNLELRLQEKGGTPESCVEDHQALWRAFQAGVEFGQLPDTDQKTQKRPARAPATRLF